MRRGRPAALVGLAVSTVWAGCGNDDGRAPDGSVRYPAALVEIVEAPDAPATDLFQVFVCDVPSDTTDPIFAGLALRLPLDPAAVVDAIDGGVAAYFDELSLGRYEPRFVAGTVLTMTATETHDHCVERAVDASVDGATAVMVVANAEHVAGASGGWGRPGSPCPDGDCPAHQTGRALYVGGSDFHPDWGAEPLRDLIEHEIGHTLGLPHSGDMGSTGAVLSSALDMMSNSAAPREMQQAATPGTDPRDVRKDAQGTLAIDRLALGWLDGDDVTVVADTGGSYSLAPSQGPTGLRMLVLPVGDDSFLSVEHLHAEGLDGFLTESGIAVHRIDRSPAGCGRTRSSAARCTGVDRVQITVGSSPPHLDLLGADESPWEVDGWTISVRDAGDEMQVEVSRTER